MCYAFHFELFASPVGSTYTCNQREGLCDQARTRCVLVINMGLCDQARNGTNSVVRDFDVFGIEWYNRYCQHGYQLIVK